MKCLLVQFDGKLPNLALMKLSTWLKSQGHTVGFNVNEPDEVYISCIFPENLQAAMGIGTYYPNSKVYLGGPALWIENHIPVGAEHVMPDYSLYPDINYSMGRTHLGCPNSCPFCIVPQIEGSFKEYAPISEFHNPDFRNLLLFDNNFFYSKLWEEKIKYIEDNGLRPSLFQGIDARTITMEKAVALKSMGAWDSKFTMKRYYSAWDFMVNSDSVLKGLQTMIDAGIKPYTIMVYMLTGFNTTHYEDYYRFRKLRELNIDPFPMKYNHRRDDQFLNHFSRWVIKRIYKSDSFSNYNPLSPELRKEVKGLEERYDKDSINSG